MMKTSWVGLLVIIALAAGSIGTYFYMKDYYADRNEMYNETMKRLYVYHDRDNRIEDMTDVLVRSYDLDSIRAYYYSMFFEKMSQKYGFDWEWYAALMRMESNFVATAKSNSRPPAKGLMQLKEKIFRAMCDSLDISYKPDTTVWDDIANILCGSHYFSIHAKEKGPKHGINVYLGGRDYMRTIKVSREDKQYVKEYSSTTLREYRRLSMAYQGIRAGKKRVERK